MIKLDEMIQTVTSLINQVGFPIAMVIMLFIQTGKRETSWKDTIRDLSAAIDNNTNVITQLAMYIKGRNKDE